MELRLAGNLLGLNGSLPGTPLGFGHLQIVNYQSEENQLEIEVQAPSDFATGGIWEFELREHNNQVNTNFFGSEDNYAQTAIDLGDRSLDSVWYILQQLHEQFSSTSSIDYDVLTQNSNSYIGTILSVLGIDVNDYISGATPNSVDSEFLGADILPPFPASGFDALNNPQTAISLNLNGSDSFDIIITGLGNDIISGNAGNDILNGGGGNDNILGGTGDDNINGEDGSDELNGNGGNDIINGGVGTDRIFGDSGHDILNGDSGDDYIFGGTGEDIISGGENDDELNGNGGNDIINGDAGNDTIDGGSGHDTLNGNADDDLIRGGTGDDIIFGGDGNDELLGQGSHDLIYGGNGNDQLTGSSGNDILHGDDGIDALFGGTGNDELNGGDGNDFLYGQGGNDIINGDAGNDQIEASSGHDTIRGGAGNDVSFGGTGSDTYVWLFEDIFDGITNFVDAIGDFSSVDILDFTALGLDGLEDVSFETNNGNTTVSAEINGQEYYIVVLEGRTNLDIQVLFDNDLLLV